MAWPAAIAAIGAAVAGGASSIFNNERNISAQEDAQWYNRYQNDLTRWREDNAVQRRAADLEAAGLSKTLAAGSAAQAGSPIKIDPVMSTDALGMEGALSGATKAAQTQQSIMASQAAAEQINLTKAQVGLTKAQELKALNEAGISGQDLQLYQTTKKWPRLPTGLGEDVLRYITSSEGLAKIKEMAAKASESYGHAQDWYLENVPDRLKPVYAQGGKRAKK